MKNQDSNPQQTVIPREALDLGKELGVGEFGSVLKGVWSNPDGEKVLTIKIQNVQIELKFYFMF